MTILSTGPIENNPVGGTRPSTQVTVKIDNQNQVNFSTVLIQGFVLNGSRTMYVSELFSVAPNQVITRTYFANLNAFEFVFTTNGAAEDDTEISVWGKNASGQLVTAHRLVSDELLGSEVAGPQGPQGDQGPQGPSGLSGFELICVSSTFSGSTIGIGIQASCPPGKIAISGGATLSSNTDFGEVILTNSNFVPSTTGSTPTGWQASAQTVEGQTLDGSATLEACVFCVDAP